MLKALTTLTLIVLPGTAFAADWSGFYAQVYGGVRTQGTSSVGEPEAALLVPAAEPLFTEIFAMNAGPAFGASFGTTTPIDGLSVGVDVMHTHSKLADFPDENLDTLS